MIESFSSQATLAMTTLVVTCTSYKEDATDFSSGKGC